MLSKIRKSNIVKSIIVGLLSLCITIMFSITDFFLFSIEDIENTIETYGSEIMVTLISSGIMSFILSVVAYNVGRKLSKYFDFSKEGLKRKDIILLICGSVIFPILLTLFDIMLEGYIEVGFKSVSFNLYNLISSLLYNGLLEELWLRYGLLTFIIYVIYHVFYSKKEEKVNKNIKIIGLIVTSLFLFNFQFNSIFSLYDFSWVLLFRAVLSDLALSLYFGYYYLKYDIKKTIFCHCIFIGVYMGVMPIFVKLLFG